jgi:magnesium-protoporphyrin IX monomethyl ester (oxidative) cyclase
MIKLAKAGVRYIQPGIESLHDGFLALLNKGNSAINNIALLKYGLEYDIEIFWNLIYQIPGEKSEYYREMLEILPLLYHFKPPNLVRIRFDRFSEYYNHPQKYGLDLAPLDRYQYVYPFNPIELDHFAYYFQNKREIQTLKQEKEDLVRSITEWIMYKKQNNLKSALYYIEEKTTSTVYDYRKCAIAQEFKLNSLEHAIYKACRHPITFDAIVSSLFILDGHSPDEDIITKILAKFKKNKILIRIGDQFLALAVKANNPKDLQLKS